MWVEVPDTPSPSRPAGLRAGLTMYVLEGGSFRTVPSSRAFPGWTAEEIHLALNEPELSDATTAALRRVGRALGTAEGTGPDDDPFLRAERLEGRLETQRTAVLQVFRTRGLPVSAALPRRPGPVAGQLHRNAGASGLGMPRRGGLSKAGGAATISQSPPSCRLWVEPDGQPEHAHTAHQRH